MFALLRWQQFDYFKSLPPEPLLITQSSLSTEKVVVLSPILLCRNNYIPHVNIRYLNTSHIQSLMCLYAVKFLTSHFLTNSAFQITNQTMPPCPLLIQILTSSYFTTQTKLKNIQVLWHQRTNPRMNIGNLTVSLELILYLIAKKMILR